MVSLYLIRQTMIMSSSSQNLILISHSTQRTYSNSSRKPFTLFHRRLLTSVAYALNSDVQNPIHPLQRAINSLIPLPSLPLHSVNIQTRPLDPKPKRTIDECQIGSSRPLTPADHQMKSVSRHIDLERVDNNLPHHSRSLPTHLHLSLIGLYRLYLVCPVQRL
jgi:hypothetical protein